jgi:hypothetical protein
MAQVSIRFGWTVYYFTQKNEFIQNCINRDKPEMQCDGKCYLRLQMGLLEPEVTPELPASASLPDFLRNLPDFLYDFPRPLSWFLLKAPTDETTVQTFAWTASWPQAPVRIIFKPPA